MTGGFLELAVSVAVFFLMSDLTTKFLKSKFISKKIIESKNIIFHSDKRWLRIILGATIWGFVIFPQLEESILCLIPFYNLINFALFSVLTTSILEINKLCDKKVNI